MRFLDDRNMAPNFGISKRSYPELDIAALTIDDAKALYKRDFWDYFHYAKITDPEVATKVFNLAVNMGGPQAHKLLQRALKAVGNTILDDGLLGPVTLLAVNQADSAPLLAALKSETAGFYRVLCILKPSNQKFLNGWLNRAYD